MTVAGSGLRSQTLFAHDTTEALRAVTALINTAYRGGRPLVTLADLATFLDDFEFTGDRTGDQAELTAIQDLRPVLEQLWDVGPDEAVPIINRLLREGGALPQLARHGEWGWHLHATEPQAPLADRIAVEAGMAFIDVIRMGEMARLRRCASEDCRAVLVDFSRNGRKRFCDLGNCGNRTHVAAYRARQREGT